MRARTLLDRILPKPNYLALRSAGIDISDTSIKYVRFLETGKPDGLELASFGDIAIPPNVVTDGDIMNIEALGGLLREARIRAKAPYARLSLPEERAYIFETEIPGDTP